MWLFINIHSQWFGRSVDRFVCVCVCVRVCVLRAFVGFHPMGVALNDINNPCLLEHLTGGCVFLSTFIAKSLHGKRVVCFVCCL